MLLVLGDKSLNLIFMIVNAIGRETEPIGIKPMMIAAEHFHLYIITDSVNQIYFKKRLATDKIPYYRLFLKFIFTTKNIIDRLLCYLP